MEKELLRIEEEGASIEITAGEISSFKTAQKTLNGVRVFKDGEISTASYVGEIGQDALVKRCLDQEGAGVPFRFELPSNSRYQRSIAKPALRGLKELQKKADEALGFLRSKNDRFIYSGKAQNKHVTKTFTNSRGVKHSLEYDECLWWLTYKHRDSKNLMDGYLAASSFSDFNFLDSVERHLPLLKAFETKIPTPSGLQKIVITNPEELLLGKLCESLRIDRYREGSCLYAGKLGQKIFNEKFGLEDLREDPGRLSFSPFDGEGTCRPGALPLIKNGIFENVICDLRYGEKYRAESTGNGLRSFDSNAGLWFNALAVGRGMRGFSELLKGMGDCIFVVLGMGEDCTDGGDFSLPVNLAFWVKNGEFQGRLEAFTLKSNLNQMFGPGFLATSSDGFFKHSLNPCVILEMEVLA
jgi:PmbA protein